MKLRELHNNVKIRIFDVFINSFSSSMYFPFMAIYFAARFGNKLTGILMILMVIFGFLAGLYAGYYADLIGRRKIILGASIARLIGVLTILLANSPFFSFHNSYFYSHYDYFRLWRN
jgi:MFS transporter, DHA1 family, multidrug resistance protein B